ncbi:hypothetical protein [Flavobacterium luteum]|uniref:Prenyltransferase n=1 Tax=Flavobacterium luteum TaxID=2026654 RepID=A0A7J5ADZ4_9FLAO|nr:hypothetical protein [Flavobacterium luteum]KAB1155713.1 hypothetical protein F6464_09320 [Flavobacterium luteum]
MIILRKLFDFYIQSSLHVGIAVFCLVKITDCYLLTKHIDNYSMLVFFGTVIGYNFLKYYDVFRNGNFHSNKHYGILVFSLLSSIGFLFFFLWLKKGIQISILISGIFVLLYPFLRKYGWLKLLFVSIVVTYVTVYIPFQTVKWMPFDFYVSLTQRFFILTSLLIPFEIMDTKTDPKSLNTLPQLFGIRKAKQLGYGFIVIFLSLDFLNYRIHNFIIDALIAIITAIFIRFTSLEKNEYYTSFWVESVPIFWLGLLILFQ